MPLAPGEQKGCLAAVVDVLDYQDASSKLATSQASEIPFLDTPVIEDYLSAMKHIDQVRTEFEKQASSFNDSRHSIGSHEIMEWIIKTVQPSPTQSVLDVAAGTALLGRALAKVVKKVTALDATRAMLEVARNAAAEEGLQNVHFLNGEADQIPFRNDEFDLVVSRLAVHHFLNPEAVISEMCRVCKSTGKVIIIDLLSPAESGLQSRYNELERMRDPSHTMALTEGQILQAFNKVGGSAIVRDIKTVEVDFETWVKLTKTPHDVFEKIKHSLQLEMDGGEVTGFRPKLVNGSIKFYQRWAIFEA